MASLEIHAAEIHAEAGLALETASTQHDAEIIERILCECARFYAEPEKRRTLEVFDRERGQFLLIDEGWDGYRHIHRLWAHVELRDHKFWIQEDGTQDGIGNMLMSAGISPTHIVLAFQAPARRKYTDFAVA